MASFHNILNKFKEEITLYLSDNVTLVKLIKTHKENLKKYGEFSFPINHFLWHKWDSSSQNSCNINNNCNIFECRFKRKFDPQNEIELLIINSTAWCIPIKKVEFTNERCFIFLDRNFVFNLVINQIITNSVHENFDVKEKNLEEYTESLPTDLFVYRKYLIKSIIKNMLHFNYKITNNNCYLKMLDNLEKFEINCGLVLDSKTGKRATLNLQEYQQLRLTDMQLVAMHKYGVRAREQDHFSELMTVLGDFAVKVDLLEVKSRSPVNIVRNGYGSTKGAAFILYNSARLETLLRKFDEKIKNGNYPSLPPLSEIDFTVLNEDEEWELCIGYILQFYAITERCLTEEVQNNYSVHLLIQFLQGLVSLFSIYYRKTRILTEHRRHLTSTVYARIYFLKSLQKILADCLFILNVKPVKYM